MARSVMPVMAAVVSAGLLWPVAAAADQSLHATGTVTTGFTNNILGVPETDTTLVQSDAFASIAPGVQFNYEAPRFRVQARYTLSARLFFRQSTANSFSNFLNARGSADVSPTSQVELAVTGSAGRINSFETEPSDAEVGQLPNGDIAYARILGSEQFTKQLSYLWRLRQTAEGAAFKPTDDTVSINTNWNFGGSLAIERGWKRHQLTLQAEGRYVHNERIDEESGDRLDPDLQVIIGPRVRWLWDISGRFSSALSLGVARISPPDDFDKGIIQPQASAQVSHFKDRTVLTLRYAHGVNTNSLVGQTSTVDRVELRGFYPTEEILENSGLTGAIGYQHAQFVDVQSERLAASSDQGALDVAGTWRQYEGMTWALRYQYSRRTRGVAVLGSTEETQRHQIQAVLTIRYPERVAVEIPERNDDRVDGGEEDQLDAQRTRQ